MIFYGIKYAKYALAPSPDDKKDTLQAEVFICAHTGTV